MKRCGVNLVLSVDSKALFILNYITAKILKLKLGGRAVNHGHFELKSIGVQENKFLRRVYRAVLFTCLFYSPRINTVFLLSVRVAFNRINAVYVSACVQ